MLWELLVSDVVSEDALELVEEDEVGDEVSEAVELVVVLVDPLVVVPEPLADGVMCGSAAPSAPVRGPPSPAAVIPPPAIIERNARRIQRRGALGARLPGSWLIEASSVISTPRAGTISAASAVPSRFVSQPERSKAPISAARVAATADRAGGDEAYIDVHEGGSGFQWPVPETDRVRMAELRIHAGLDAFAIGLEPTILDLCNFAV